MPAMLDFMRVMFVNGAPLAAWIGLLLVVNFMGPLVYLESTEAKVVLAAGLAGAGIQAWLFQRLGFVRLLGVGHAPWVPMVAWLLARPTPMPTGDGFALWIWSVILIDSVSLVIDTTDVVRYVRGEREPHLAG